MIASAIGRPRVPARMTEFGVPPMATQIASGRPSWRGWTWTLSSGARNLPCQVTG